MDYDLLGQSLNFDIPIYGIVFGRAKSPAPRPKNRQLNAEVKALIAFRRKREALFGAELFADPAWDMLLDLFLASNERRHVSVSSLCIASATPPTTALRWIKTLEAHGFIQREADHQDKRRIFLSLAPDVEEKLNGLLSERFDVPIGPTKIEPLV